jgi:SAM-dependent methyltransferase
LPDRPLSVIERRYRGREVGASMSDGTSEGYLKWTSPGRTEVLRRDAELNSAAAREETELLLRATGIPPGARVLDIACGPGDPSLAIATRVGPSGRVVGVDISAGALDVARERAHRGGLENVRFEVANAESLPFEDATFDRVVCRFGAMFFEDLPKASREVHRVLTKGGRAAFMVWGAFEQPYILGTVGVILRHLDLGEPPGDMGRPFRFADPSELVRALQAAGLENCRADGHTVHWVWRGDATSARDHWRQGLVFWRELVERLPGGESSPAWDEILEMYRGYEDNGMVRIPLEVNVITADRR